MGVSRSSSSISVLARALVVAALVAAICCACAGLPALELPAPDHFVVYDGSAAMSVGRGDVQFSKLMAALCRFHCSGALASAVDPDEDLIAGAAVELWYEEPIAVSVPDGRGGWRARSCDRVVLCFAGDHAGEVVFGLGGRCQNGTVAHPLAWGFVRQLLEEP